MATIPYQAGSAVEHFFRLGTRWRGVSLVLVAWILGWRRIICLLWSRQWSYEELVMYLLVCGYFKYPWVSQCIALARDPGDLEMHVRMYSIGYLDSSSAIQPSEPISILFITIEPSQSVSRHIYGSKYQITLPSACTHLSRLFNRWSSRSDSSLFCSSLLRSA